MKIEYTQWGIKIIYDFGDKVQETALMESSVKNAFNIISICKR